jgi:maleamate amidohydrolase
LDKKDLDANYANTGFNVRLGFGRKPALVLIDFVQGYFVECSPLFHPLFGPSLEAAIRLKKAAHAAGIPVVITRLEVQKGGIGGGVFFEKIRGSLESFEPGNPLGELATGLEADPLDIIVWKRYASAFFGTALSSALTSLGVDTVLLAGVSTSGCVRATCVDAISYGFRPMVVREAVGDRHTSVHEANLYDMNAKYADVVSEQEAITYLGQLTLP